MARACLHDFDVSDIEVFRDGSARGVSRLNPARESPSGIAPETSRLQPISYARYRDEAPSRVDRDPMWESLRPRGVILPARQPKQGVGIPRPVSVRGPWFATSVSRRHSRLSLHKTVRHGNMSNPTCAGPCPYRNRWSKGKVRMQPVQFSNGLYRRGQPTIPGRSHDSASTVCQPPCCGEALSLGLLASEVRLPMPDRRGGWWGRLGKWPAMLTGEGPTPFFPKGRIG